jgi:hypothetical protein
VSNVSQFGGNAVVTGTGASGLGIPRFTVSNDSNILVTQSGTWTVQQGTPPWTVMGNAASGSADSGNPVKGGSVFNTTQPTVTTGQRVDLQGTARGGLIVATGTDSFNVNNVTGTISLPTGASTSANQTNGSQTTQINQGGNTAAVTASSALKVDGSAVTQPITGPVSQGTAAAISGRWPVQLTDGTNVSTVKAASTAAVAGDTSVVVAMSPNSPIPSGTNSIGSVRILDSAGMSITLGQKSAAASVPVVTQANEIPLTASITAQDTGSTSTSFANSQAFITGTPTAGSTASFSFSSFEAVEVQVTGVWTGTLMTEVSMDSGTTWFARGVKQSGLSYISNSFTANFEGGLNVAGITNFRVRSTAAWTGTATVAVVQSVNTASVIVSNPQMLRDGTTQSIVNTIKPASTAAVAADPALVVAVSPNNTVSVVGNVASGSADSGNPVKVGSVFNSTLPTPSSGQRVDLQGDKNGRLITLDVPSDGYKATYSASILGLSATTTPTDIFTITGSATKTVRVTRFVLTATQQTSATRDVQLIIRSTADSGGTSTTQTAVPYDSSSAAATATVLAYTANPTTLGTLVGAISARKMNILATNVTSAGDRWEENFGNRPSQAIVLRGTSQQLCVNLNSVTSSGNSFDIYVEWTEE